MLKKNKKKNIQKNNVQKGNASWENNKSRIIFTFREFPKAIYLRKKIDKKKGGKVGLELCWENVSRPPPGDFWTQVSLTSKTNTQGLIQAFAPSPSEKKSTRIIFGFSN